MSAQLAMHPTAERERRAVVESALRKLLDGRQIAQALSIWDLDFAYQPKLSGAAVCQALSDGVAGAPPAKLIGKVLAREFRRAKAEKLGLAAVTNSAVSGVTNTQPTVTSTHDPGGLTDTMLQVEAGTPSGIHADVPDEVVVFSELLMGIVAKLDQDTRTELRASVEVDIAKAGLSKTGLTVLRPWCVGIDRKLTRVDMPVELADLRHVVHLVYVWLCEYDGPVPTDKLFNRVIRTIESMPEAADFAPRKLL